MNYAPEIIGVAKYTGELATFLAAQGHAVEVITALPHYPSWTVQDGHRPFRAGLEDRVKVTRCLLLARPGRKIWRLVAPLSFAVAAAPVVLWRILRSRPQTVLCIEPTLFAAPIALLAAWLVGARTVLHVQDLELDAALATNYLGRVGPLPLLARRFEQLTRGSFDAVITISDAMAARLRRQVTPAKLSVLRNWVRTETLAPRTPSAEIRRMLGVPPHARLVLYAGNFGAKQGLPVLVDAARQLRADPSIQFLVVGDGVMAGPLRAAAAALPNFHCSGLLPFEQLGSLLAAADLHVLPQERAASDLVFPSKLGPLLMSGKPLVVTAEPHSELAVWLGAAALRCTPGCARSLAMAVKEGLRRSTNTDMARAADLLSSLAADAILRSFEECLLKPSPEVASAWTQTDAISVGQSASPALA